LDELRSTDINFSECGRKYDGLSDDGWHVILQEASREETALLAGNEDKMAAHIL
jgi:hypothetical protein